MMQQTERYFWVGMLAASIAFAAAPRLFSPKPYTDVELIATEQVGQYRYITVNFVKNDGCTVQEVVWIGKRLGVVYELTEEWEPLNLFEDDPGEHRTAGEQTLMGRIDTGRLLFDTFEIRTRHDCNGRRVDRTFITIDAGDDLTWVSSDKPQD